MTSKINLNRDTIVSTLAGLAAALLSLAVQQGWIAASDAAAIGGLVATFTAGYHVNNAKASQAVALTRPAPADGPITPAVPVHADAPPADVTPVDATTPAAS